MHPETAPGQPITTVVGGGPMGLAVASFIAHNVRKLYLWVPDARTYNRWKNERYLQVGEFSFNVPFNVEIITGYDHFKDSSHFLIFTIPSRQYEEVTENILYHLNRSLPHQAVNFTKGFLSSFSRRKHGCYLFHQLLHSLRDQYKLNLSVALVTGPSLLYDIIHNNYVFFVIASNDPSITQPVVDRLKGEHVHWSTTDDMIGAEVGGIMKNPLAILGGMVEALPFVTSSLLGELMAAGFSEIRKVNAALGGREETILGRSGLADLAATFFSPYGRNRSYGRSFTEKLIRGELSPNLIEQIQLFLVPSLFIEKEVLSSRNLAEGGLAITPIIEIAAEFQLDLPLNRMLYDIFLRRKSPEDIITLLTGKSERRNRIPVIRKKGRVELVASGRMISDHLRERILHRITLTRGMQARIKKQCSHVISSLEKRRARALRMKQRNDAKNFGRELLLWKELAECREEEELQYIEQLVRFYTDSIADYYVPAARTMLMRFVAPFRWMLGGFRRGSVGPIVNGPIREIRNLVNQYPVFYVPTHRTHIDSVELIYGLFFKGFPLPRFAAASILMSNPIWGTFLKSMGAYAVDRENTRNILYLEVLTQYTTMMLESGIPALAYPEGTRSRTGEFQPIKTGLLSTAIDAFRESGHEIIILPISISHQWVPEDLVFNNQAQETGFWTYVFRRRRTYMDFGEPIRVSDFADREEPTQEIASIILQNWKKTFRLQPHFIVARILSDYPGMINREELLARIEAFLASYTGTVQETSPEKVMKIGLKLLKKRNFITETRKGFEILNPSLVEYYGNFVPIDGASGPVDSAE
jgi:1-acyl-sn-glycerol-3-phosphate acyltransferase